MINPNLPKLILNLSLISILFYAPIAEAKYRPRRVKTYTGTTGTTGTRGICDNSKPQQRLTAIAPLSHIGETSSSTPSVTWFVPDSTSHSLILRLWDDNKIVGETPLESTSGLMTVPLPATLVPDRTYRWQISLICDPSRPSKNQVTHAFITHNPTIAPASEERWYDALNAALPNPKQYQELLTDLKTIETDALTTEPKESDRFELLEQHVKSLNNLPSAQLEKHS